MHESKQLDRHTNMEVFWLHGLNLKGKESELEWIIRLDHLLMFYLVQQLYFPSSTTEYEREAIPDVDEIRRESFRSEMPMWRRGVPFRRLLST